MNVPWLRLMTVFLSICAFPAQAAFHLFRIDQTAIEHSVARQFQALADEIERQGAIARSHAIAVVE